MDALGLTSGTVSVCPTAEGLDLFDRIAPVHLAGEDLLLSALSPDEQDRLAALLRKLPLAPAESDAETT